MADILQGNKREGYWASEGGSSGPNYEPAAEYRRKWDNFVLVDGEAFFDLQVIERTETDSHESGIVEMGGQRFPVWRLLGASGAGTRAYFGKPWRLGKWGPNVKARYYLEIYYAPDDGNKKERKALAFLQEKGLVFEKVWREPIWGYAGYVSLTYAEYCQALEMNKLLHLQDR